LDTLEELGVSFHHAAAHHALEAGALIELSAGLIQARFQAQPRRPP